MTNPTNLPSDDELAKLGAAIVEASEEIEDCLLSAAGEIACVGDEMTGLVDPQRMVSSIRLRLSACCRSLAQAGKARRELLERMMSYSAEAGYPMRL